MTSDPTRAQHMVEALLPMARLGNAHAARAVYLLWTSPDPEATVDRLLDELVAYAVAVKPVLEPWLGLNHDWAPRVMRDAIAHAHGWGRH